MTDPQSVSERLERAFADPRLGVIGLVDELIAASRDQSIRLFWHAGRCRASLPSGDRVEVAVPRSVFRATLARVAALCDERSPGSVSPFGGRGEITVGGEPAMGVQVAFVNTPDVQSLELTPSRPEARADFVPASSRHR